jgi:WD40 repeat protein
VLAALETVPAHLRDQTWNYLQGEADTSRLLPEALGESLYGIQAHPGRPSVFAAVDRTLGAVVLFNVRDGRRLLEFVPGFTTRASKVSFCLALSGDRVAVGRGGSGGLVVHDVNDGRKILEWDAPRSHRLEFSPDGTLLLQIGRNRSGIQMWNARDGTPLWSQKGDYHAARFTSDGRHLARYSWFNQLQLIRSDDGAKVIELADNYFQEMATDPAGQLIVGANPLGFVRGFDAVDGRQRFEVQPHESLISYTAFLPGGERFLTAATLPDDRMALQCWDAHTGRLCQTLLGGSGKISDIALHPLSGELIVGSRKIQVWDTISVPALRVIRGGNAHPSAAFWGSRDVLFSPGSTLSSANLQSIAEQPPKVLWRASTYDHGQPSISADGRRVAIGRYSASQPIAVLERNDDGNVSEIASLPLNKLMDYVRISPTGDRVAIVQQSFSELRVLNVSSRTQSVALAVQDIKRFSDVAWLDGGKHLAGLVTTYASRSAPGSAEQLVLWDTATGQRIRSMTNHSVMTVACASPDGRQFVEGGMDRNIRLRDARTLQVLREFRVHNAPLTALAWHPSRRILATASEDLVIRLWNLDDGTRLEELRGPLSPPSVLSFSPDGTRLATAARDRVARIWEPRSLVEPRGEK